MTDTAMSLPLNFEGREVRFCGTAERPEWVAADVCAVLEIAKTDRALSGFDEDEKGAQTVSTLGGPQKVATVYEPGLYKLIFRSRKPQAARFRRWVFHEVLPSIRKTGAYGLQSELDAARAQVVLLLQISTQQASVNASMLARRGHQLRTEEKAFLALARGQRLLIPGAEPIKTVERAARRTASLIRRATARLLVLASRRDSDPWPTRTTTPRPATWSSVSRRTWMPSSRDSVVSALVRSVALTTAPP